jgi:nitronate monooxygenase
MNKDFLNTKFKQQLGIEFPLFLGPLGAGPSTPELVAEVSNCGCFGFLGAAYLPPTELEEILIRLKKLTQRPFGINLFVPSQTPALDEQQIQKALSATNIFRKKLNIDEPAIKPPYQEDFTKQFELVLKYQPTVFSFTFGTLDKNFINDCHQRGILTIGTATNLDEARTLEANGVDAVVAQGLEAGGHRALFQPDQKDELLGTFVLTRLLSQELSVPIIAAGGIMDGKGIAAALVLGAQAVQLGTAFLACDEAGTSQAYRDALLNFQDKKTILTKTFSGRWARGIENEFIKTMTLESDTILPFPAQNFLTRDIRKQAAATHQKEYLSLWAGQGYSLIRKMPAKKLIALLREETIATLDK